MADLKIKTDILAPESVKVINFSGYNTPRFLKIVPSLMKEVFRLSGSKFFEDKIKWDTSTESTSFYGEWRGKDDKDGRTSVWVKIKLQGSQHEKEKKGNIAISISGQMVTKFGYSNFLDKGLYWTYSKLFYSDLRRRYFNEAKKNLEQIEMELKKELEAVVE